MADNASALGKIAASLGSGVKSLFGPLLNVFGKTKPDPGEESRLEQYLVASDWSGFDTETTESVKKIAQNVTSALARDWETNTSMVPGGISESGNIRESAANLYRALGEEAGAGGAAFESGGSETFTGTIHSAEIEAAQTEAARTDSAIETLTAALGDWQSRERGVSFLEGLERAVSASVSASANHTEVGGHAASSENFQASGGAIAENSIERRNRILAGLGPLAVYFEGIADAPVAGEKATSFVAPVVIPPAPAGGGNTRPVESQIEFKGMEIGVKANTADVEEALARRERYGIQRMLSASNNGGGF